jgi:hypothetical protein
VAIFDADRKARREEMAAEREADKKQMDPLRNGKKEIAHGGGTGNTEAPASPERE